MVSTLHHLRIDGDRNSYRQIQVGREDASRAVCTFLGTTGEVAGRASLLRAGLGPGQPKPGRPVPLDRLAQPFLERRGGLEAEEVRGPRGVEAAARLAVGLVRVPHEAPGEPGELHDQRRDVADRDLEARAEVDQLGCLVDLPPRRATGLRHQRNMEPTAESCAAAGGPAVSRPEALRCPHARVRWCGQGSGHEDKRAPEPRPCSNDTPTSSRTRTRLQRS